MNFTTLEKISYAWPIFAKEVVIVKYTVLSVLLLSAVMVLAAPGAVASGRKGGNCEDCPMSSLSGAQRAEIRQQLKALKGSGATGEEIRDFKAGILEEYGVEMPEGRKGRGRNRQKRGK